MREGLPVKQRLRERLGLIGRARCAIAHNRRLVTDGWRDVNKFLDQATSAVRQDDWTGSD